MFILLLLSFLLIPHVAWSAIACTGQSFPFDVPTNPQTQAYTVPSVTNGVTFIGFSVRNGARTVSGTPTIGGQNLTIIGARTNSTDTVTYAYYRIGVSSGSQTISIQYDNTPLSLVITAVTCEGVDQVNPVASNNSATGSATPITVNCSSAVGQLVIDFMGGDGTATITAGAGQTEIDKDTADTVLTSGSSFEDGAASVTMSWSTSGNDWSQICASIAPFVTSTRRIGPMVLP